VACKGLFTAFIDHHSKAVKDKPLHSGETKCGPNKSKRSRWLNPLAHSCGGRGTMQMSFDLIEQNSSARNALTSH